MLLLFMFGERFHLIPAVTALVGATALLVWIRPDIEEMIEAVDWTTLVFFMALFIVVGAIQEVGLISLIAEMIGRLVGDSLVLAMLSIVWISAILSMVVANIPFTAAMLPVVGFLTLTVPGAESKVLFFCLSVGAAHGRQRITDRCFSQHGHLGYCRAGRTSDHLCLLLYKGVSGIVDHSWAGNHLAVGAILVKRNTETDKVYMNSVLVLGEGFIPHSG